MAFHHRIQQILLVGARLPSPPPPPRCPPPEALVPLIAAIAPSHQAYNDSAMAHGDRYRSAFWAIYLLVALAVLLAVLPLALGWDEASHPMHAYAGGWVIAEVFVIALVGLLYGLGHRGDWQGRWLAARTRAELAWYLPVVAPFADFGERDEGSNWYACLDSGSADLQPCEEFKGVCAAHELVARDAMDVARQDPGFQEDYVRWVVSLLAGQQHYHQRVGVRQQALRHRIHRTTTALFALTALAAVAHLVWHSGALTVATVFFPVLGASLHGALAQSEAYRLQATSERLFVELGDAAARVAKVGAHDQALDRSGPLGHEVLGAIRLILDEHQDWHMLVRPHHLPLG